MKMLLLMVLGLTVCFFAGAARADDVKDAAKLLVGKWEVTKTADDGPPEGAICEMTKDGKLIVTAKEEKHEGTYKVKGNKITVTFKMGDEEKSHTVTIKKISATEFTVENEQGKTYEFKKK